jgi:PAS domain S-box-containing protein
VVPTDAVADEILRKVVGLVKTRDGKRLRALDAFPVAIYVTDIDGFITYFNPTCIEFAGREPAILRDRWCVTWRLYTDEGDFLPHHRCPMAVAIHTRRAVRGVTAVAERPDGTRINFLPFPTPVVDDAGELLGAVNMLIDITGHQNQQAEDISDDPQTLQGQRIKAALSTFSVEEIRDLIKEIELSLNRRPPRIIN